MTHEEISHVVGRSRSSVSNLIGSKKKIDALREIIDEHSIGTSKDSFTIKRPVNGDIHNYNNYNLHYKQLLI
jgi:hypothetical protein